MHAPGATQFAASRTERMDRQIQGKFDAGWDVYREETLARQRNSALSLNLPS